MKSKFLRTEKSVEIKIETIERECVPNWNKVIKIVIVDFVLTIKKVIHSIAVANTRNCSVVLCFCVQFEGIFSAEG